MEELIRELVAEKETSKKAFFIVEECIVNDALKYKIIYISNNIKENFDGVIHIDDLQTHFLEYYNDFLEAFNEAAKTKSIKEIHVLTNEKNLDLSIKYYEEQNNVRVFLCEILNFETLMKETKELGLFVEYIKYKNNSELSIFEISSMFARLLGYEEYQNKSLYYFIDGDNFKLALKELTALALKSNVTINTELNFLTKDKNVISLHIISEYIKNGDYWNAILMPLSSSSNIVEMITKNSPFGVIALDTNNKEILYSNTFAYEILKNNNWLESNEEYFKYINNNFYAIVLKVNSKENLTLTINLKNDSEVYILFSKHIVLGTRNINILYISDITDSFSEAKKEREKSQQFEDLINNSPGAVCLFKWDGGTIKPVVVGDVFIELLGVPYEKIMGKNVIDFFKAVHPEDLFVFTSEIRRMLYETKKLHGIFKLFNFSEEKYRSVLIDARCVPQKDGSQFINSCFTDVSDEIEKTKLLNEVSAKIKLMYEHIPGAIFSCKIDKNWSLIHANEEFYSFLGYNENSFRKMYGTRLASLMFEEDSKKLSEVAISRMKSHSKTHILMEIRLKSTSGVKWVSLSGEVLEDDDSMPYCYFVFVDITEFKQNQIKQENEHAMLRELLTSLPCGMFIFEPCDNPKIHYVNEMASEILAYNSKSDMLNTSNYLFSYINNDSKEIIKNFKEGKGIYDNIIFVDALGNEIKTKSSLYIHNDESGKSFVYLLFYKYY